ncbi:isoprenyl transferase [Pseudoclavibacter soli]|uniref:isoprenyl transferase n=1 Tax=Pseudoclavibacter soli TaxID=452623 RepID=UPI000423E04E|nr:isoprenyl transferase [Pseudoclavibacter soli]
MATRETPAPLLPIDYAGGQPPAIDAKFVPKHVAIVMDGNGRWANQRGLTRTEGHRAGEQSLLDVVAGAIQIGIKHLSVYAFSTENWKRSPEEVRFLMGFNRDVLHRRRDQLHAWGVRVRWAGRRPKLWRSVIKDLEIAEDLTRHNTVMDLTMCVNYGGRAEIVDAVRAIAADAQAGRIKPRGITEHTIATHLSTWPVPDVDLFLRPSGEQRISNFLLWQSAYAELVFQNTLWPDFRRADLWDAVLEYAHRDRRFGGAVDAPRTLAGSPRESAAPGASDR